MTFLGLWLFLILSFSFLNFCSFGIGLKITDVITLQVYDRPATYLGEVKFALFGENAPISVSLLTSACRSGSSEAVGLWYRTLRDFLIQGYLSVPKPPEKLNQDQVPSGQSHHRGSISLANPGPGPVLTSSENKHFENFFVLFSDSPWLDDKHVILGHVVSGLDILEKLSKESTEEFFSSSPYIWRCSLQRFTPENSSSIAYALLLKDIPSQITQSFNMLNELIDSNTLSPIDLYDAMYALVSISDSRRQMSFEEIKARLILISEYTGRAEPLCDLATRYHSRENTHQAFLQAKFCCQAPYPTVVETLLKTSGQNDLAEKLKYFYNVTRFDYLGIYAFPAGEYQTGYDATLQALKADPTDVRLQKNLHSYEQLSSSIWPRKITVRS